MYGSQTDTTWFSLRKRNCYPIPFLSVLMATILNKNMYSAFCFLVCYFSLVFFAMVLIVLVQICVFFLLVMSYSFYSNRKVSLILTFYISHFMEAENMLTDSQKKITVVVFQLCPRNLFSQNNYSELIYKWEVSLTIKLCVIHHILKNACTQSGI